MAEAYSLPGGPVVVDKMEESPAQEQGGQILLAHAQLVSGSAKPIRIVPEPTWKAWMSDPWRVRQCNVGARLTCIWVGLHRSDHGGSGMSI